MRPATFRAALVLIPFSAGAASAQTAAPADLELPGHVVDVTATEFAFLAPDTIPAGLTTFRLTQGGRVSDGDSLTPVERLARGAHEGDSTHGLHMLWVVRLQPGGTAAGLYAAAVADTAYPGRLLGGPGFTLPSRSTNATMTLEPGNYVLVCYVGSARADRRRYHLLRGMLRPLTVVATDLPAQPMPEPDVVVTMDTTGTRFSAPLTRAGVWRIRVVNATARRTEFGIRRVLPGHTAQEALSWRRADGEAQVTEPWGGLAGVSAGESMLMTIDLPPGTYLARGVAFTVVGGGS